MCVYTFMCICVLISVFVNVCLSVFMCICVFV